MPKSKITLKRRKAEMATEPEAAEKLEDDDNDCEVVEVVSKRKKVEHKTSKKDLLKESRTNTANVESSPKMMVSTRSGKTKTNLQKLEAMARGAAAKKKEAYNDAVSDEKKTLPWVEKNFPNNLEEHFVHKKRVADLRKWLQDAWDSSMPKILLLSGPTGSGKTATLHLLANEAEIEIKEWINPMSLTQYQADRQVGDDVYGRSQTDLFSDFLLRSSQYSALPMKGKQLCDKQLVVIEDIPNIFYKETDSFLNILRNYQSSGDSPLVFIVADNASGAYNPSRVFPNHVIEELRIEQMSFNPIAPTLMVKFLALVCSREDVIVQQNILEKIATISCGDMRCAINTLQFKILQENPSTNDKGGFKIPLPKMKKFTRDKVFQGDDVANKDETLFLFRALGKVLYNKRNRSISEDIEHQLHPSLKAEQRLFPTEDDANEIANKVEVSCETFMGFLHQNYTNFFSSIEEVAKGVNSLAHSEYLLSCWNYEDSGYGQSSFKNQDKKNQYALNISIRGLMHSNATPAASKWRPLRKPMYSDISQKTKKLVETSRNLFPTANFFSEGFYYEDIPLLAKAPSKLSNNQKQIACEIGLFQNLKPTHKLKWTETLDEKFADCEGKIAGEEEALESSVLPSLISKEVKSCEGDPYGGGTAEDFQIDEFEDDD